MHWLRTSVIKLDKRVNVTSSYSYDTKVPGEAYAGLYLLSDQC